MWQQVYAEINDPNFVIVCVAEDTGGEAAAGPIFDAADPTYIQVVDENHVISGAFNFTNVPSAAWIDEEGRIVRIDEGTYAKVHELGEGDASITFGTDVYTPAVRDWVKNGADSRYVKTAAEVAADIRGYSADQLKADAAFVLGNFFRSHGHQVQTEKYWALAQALNPDSINYIRQNLTLSEEGSAGETFIRIMGEYATSGKDYYRPMDLG